MGPARFTDQDIDDLLVVCGIYDGGIVAMGLAAVITGHLAGGVAIASFGAVPLIYTVVERARHGRPSRRRGPGRAHHHSRR